jgi:hypothetical protein
MQWVFLLLRTKMHEFDDLRVLLQAHSPLIVIESYEEPRALLLIKRLAINLMRPLFKWSITEGLQRLDAEHSAQTFNAEPTNLLAQIKATRNPALFVLCDFHPFLADAKHIRYIKEIAQAHEQLGHTLILLSHAIVIPPEQVSLLVQNLRGLTFAEVKRLAYKAIAGSWSLPLLRLDMAALYNKFIGETEKNLAQAQPLSVVMAEQVHALRQWALKRCVKA